jgi:uncharacterized membrane-anchored protein YhcB (DUF1043 family)
MNIDWYSFSLGVIAGIIIGMLAVGLFEASKSLNDDKIGPE